jgi:prephenate dehydrogenase
MRVAILGFGLIGGSLARALATAADREAWSVTAWSPAGEGTRQAVVDGVIERAAATAAEALEGAELVVIAAPPTATITLLERLGNGLRAALEPDAVVTDVASTKGAIVAAATERGLRFVGGHPMAGRETSGYGSASADLFAGRPWVVVPTDPDDRAAIVTVETLAVASGARPVRMDAAEHDAVVAAISHLPLVVAAALVESVAGDAGADDGQAATDWPTARQLAASGWRDTTRLARGDAAMGSGIAVTNAPAIAARLHRFRAVIDGWLAELERPGGPDEAALTNRLAAARDRLGEAP